MLIQIENSPSYRWQLITDSPLTEYYQTLQHSRWSLVDFMHLLPAIIEQANRLCPRQRTAWLHVLRYYYQEHTDQLNSQQQASILELAIQWQDWPLVLFIQQRNNNNDLDGFNSISQALAYWQLGEAKWAAEILMKTMLKDIFDQRLYHLYNNIINDWYYCQQLSYYQALQDIKDEELRLLPLNSQHIEAFRWQYCDSLVTENTCLPVFNCDKDWFDWLYKTAQARQHCTLAIISKAWGFVGVIALEDLYTKNCPYIWLGPDFRGQGLAKRACSQLHSVMQRNQRIHSYKTWAYAHNDASLALLKQFGFSESDGLEQADTNNSHRRINLQKNKPLTLILAEN